LSAFLNEGTLNLPSTLLVLLRSPRIKKVGVHIKGDLTRLFNNCGFQLAKDQPFAGAVDLGLLAHARKLIERSTISLSDLTATILHYYLPKDPSIRLGTDWGNPDLSAQQAQYAALDVYASWAIYEAICLVKKSSPVSSTTLPGTYVKLLSRDHQTPVAYGVIPSDHPLTFQGVNVTKTRSLVNITLVKVPGYLVRADLVKSKEECPLSSLFTTTPFDLLCQNKDLQICTKDEYQKVHKSTVSGPLPAQPFTSSQSSLIDTISDEELLSLEEVFAWVIGEPFHPDDQELQTSQPDADGDARAKKLDSLKRACSSDPILSRVLGDIYHLMAMFKISVHHGLRRPFARALRDAIFIPDEEDKAAVSQVLETRHIGFEEMVLRDPGWVWKRVRRYVPPPEILYPRVKLVLQIYGPLKDAITGQPLFNQASWDKVESVLENIQQGYYSDPPNIALYINQGIDIYGLTIFKCLRGTNHVEGGVHQNIAKRFGSYNASPRFAVNLLRDYCLTHNLKVNHTLDSNTNSLFLLSGWNNEPHWSPLSWFL
jgi:hypothetical protein